MDDDRRIEVAVLDLAGTTVADPGIVRRAVQAVTGSAFDDAVFGAHRGGSKLDMLSALVGDDRGPSALVEFEGQMLAAIASGRVVPLPHAEHALAQMASAGVQVCLTTGFPAVIRQALITSLGWEASIALSLSPGEACRGRPWPDLIWTAALALKATDMASVAAVGDTVNDVLAGHRSGAAIAAAVLTGAHDRPTLEAAGPSHLFDHIGQFADLVVG